MQTHKLGCSTIDLRAGQSGPLLSENSKLVAPRDVANDVTARGFAILELSTVQSVQFSQGDCVFKKAWVAVIPNPSGMG